MAGGPRVSAVFYEVRSVCLPFRLLSTAAVAQRGCGEEGRHQVGARRRKPQRAERGRGVSSTAAKQRFWGP